MTPMTINQLEQAINQARASAPAQGQHAALSRDVSLMAAVYGELIFRHHKGFDVDSLDSASREAVRRWSKAGQQAA